MQLGCKDNPYFENINKINALKVLLIRSKKSILLDIKLRTINCMFVIPQRNIFALRQIEMLNF